MAWPPPAMSRPLSFAASTAAPRSTPEIERPEPLPMPSSPSATTMAGRCSFSLSRPATMPITPGCQPGAATIATARLPWRAGSASAASQTAASIAAALLVEPVELGGDRLGLGRILGGEQADAEIGLADPAAGIDPRAEREAEIAAFGRAVEAGGVGERGEADVAAPGHHLQPLGHEGAVEAAELGDVGDRAERDEIEQLDQLRLLAAGEIAAPAQRPQQGRAEQEGHADRGEMAVGGALVALVEPVRVDDGEAVGERGSRICDGRRRSRRRRPPWPWPAPRTPGRRNRR